MATTLPALLLGLHVLQHAVHSDERLGAARAVIVLAAVDIASGPVELSIAIKREEPLATREHPVRTRGAFLLPGERIHGLPRVVHARTRRAVAAFKVLR
eukprot:scaffold13013_cov128-Isochrysis_galbana.AAC.4